MNLQHQQVISVNSDKSNDNPVAVESKPAPKVISVKSKLIAGVVVPVEISNPVPTVTLVTLPVPYPKLSISVSV